MPRESGHDSSRPSQIMLPDAEDAPAVGTQMTGDGAITRGVGVEFPFPKGAIVPRHVGMFGAAVPEAAIDKDRDALFAKHEIRPAKHIGMTPPAGDFVGPENRDQRQFRLLVPAPADFGHHLGTLLFGEDVGHSL